MLIKCFVLDDTQKPVDKREFDINIVVDDISIVVSYEMECNSI